MGKAEDGAPKSKSKLAWTAGGFDDRERRSGYACDELPKSKLKSMFGWDTGLETNAG